MTKNIGHFRVTIDFELIPELLDQDILCDESGDWDLDETGDWKIADEKVSFKQDLDTSFNLRLFEDIIDPEQGNRLKKFKQANYTPELAIELKQEIYLWLEKDDRININSLEVDIEGI